MPILVTGATGRHGGNGAHLVQRLRQEGRTVRVLARTTSDRTEALAAAGAEVIFGDLRDRRSLVPALADVDLAYFTYPIDAGVITAAANYAAAVRESGRNPRTVVMSMGPAHPQHPSDRGRDQWLAEEILMWAGLEVLVLRVVAAFHENIAVLHAHTIRDDNAIRNDFGDNAVAWINGRDAAELAIAALLNPERFTGPICYPPGFEDFTQAQIAEILTEELHRPIRFEPISRDAWRQEIVELAKAQPGGVINADMAGHISSVGYAIARNGPTLPADADTLRTLIGKEPISLRQYLRANLGAMQSIS
jgi:uncharacterized protein YbjT (DUF2867 family)